MEITKAAETIAASFPEVILCIGRRHATYNFILKIINKGIMRTSFLGTSYLLPIQEPLFKARGIPLITIAHTPDLNASSPLPLIEEYKHDMETYTNTTIYNSISLQGYLQARIALVLLEKCNLPITAMQVRTQAEQLQNYDLGGLNLSYDPTMPGIRHQTWISPGYLDAYISWKPNLTGAA